MQYNILFSWFDLIVDTVDKDDTIFHLEKQVGKTGENDLIYEIASNIAMI